MNQRIARFLDGGPFAVVGASRQRGKYGNKVLRCYVQNGLEAVPVNPRESSIEGLACYADMGSIPGPVHGASIITPPEAAEQVVTEAAGAAIRHLWFQPGAESPEALDLAAELGISVVAGGPCLLVVLGFHE